MNQESMKPILFTRGNPAEEALPIAEIIDCANTVFPRDGKIVFQYGHYSGYSPLREWLARRYDVKVEQVLLGNGSMEFFTFVGSLMVKAGDTVFLERPSYDRAITSMKRAGARIIGIPLEKDGVDIDRLKAELTTSTPKVFYLIPDFQNPSGVTTSSEKRKELVRLAEECGFYLVEDAPYRLLRYRGKEAPALRDLLPDRVIHISSFSKTLSPGMRIGYMILPLTLAPSFHKWSEDTYIHPVLPTEGIVNEYCRKGLLEPNIEKLKNLYRPRLDAILNALRQHLKGATWIEPEGGFFVSVTLPEAIDGHALWKNARDFGIVLTDGRGFFPDGKGENFVRLPFCALRPDEIEEGIRRLTKAIDAHRK